MAETADIGKEINSRYLIPVKPVLSSRLTAYLQPGQYPEPPSRYSDLIPNTNADVISDTNNILQAFTYWLVIAHTICKYSLVGQLARKPMSLASIILQSSSALMKIEYSDGEIWYYEFISVMFNEVCNFIPLEYDFTINTERISVHLSHERKDIVYTMWIKILFPKEHTGFAHFNLWSKTGEKVAYDGAFLFDMENLFIHVKLVLKKIDSHFQKDDIYFRMPELTLDYDYTRISAQVAREPKFKIQNGDSSTPKPNIRQMLIDFFAQQLDLERKTLAQRFSQNLLNQVGMEIMKAKSVYQCLCILNEALTRRPAVFENCSSELIRELTTEAYFLVNDEKSRDFMINFFANSLPNENSIFIFNRAFFSNEYATINSIMKFPLAEESKSTLRRFLTDERKSMLKFLDENVN